MTSFQLMITVGIVIAYGVNTAAESQVNGAFRSELPVYLASLAAGVLFVRESPRWLIAVNRYADARSTLGEAARH